MKSVLTTLILVLAIGLRAQCTIYGVAYSEAKPVAGVQIEILDALTQKNIQNLETDLDGKFKSTLTVSQIIFKAKFGAFIEQVDTINLSGLTEKYIEIQFQKVTESKKIDISVKRKNLGGDVITGITFQLKNPGTVSVMTSQELNKMGVSGGIGSALAKMPATTIVEGKYANIRGMNDRYNAGYLNGSPMPITETDRKAFSFDIIPTNLVESIVIYKSGTPNLTGDFGGGVIQINTKSIPVKRIQTFSVGFQYNSTSTFQSVEAFDNGNLEKFGWIDKAHQLPVLNGKLIGSPTENTGQTEKFNNNWQTNTITPGLAPRFNYSIGLPIKLGKKRELGVIAAINYAYSNKYITGTVRTHDLSDNRIIRDFTDRVYSVNVQNGSLVNLSYKWNNFNRIDLRNLYSINYDANSNFRTGLADADDNKYADGYSSFANQNQLFNSQLSGNHQLIRNPGEKGKTLIFTWNANAGRIHRFMPDYRIAQYIKIDTSRYFIFNDFFNAGSGRFFSNLLEKSINGTADLAYSFDWKKIHNTIKGGLYVQERNRVFNSRKFVYAPITKILESKNEPATDLSIENLKKLGIYLIEKTAYDLDEYTGTANLKAAYLMAENEIAILKYNDNQENKNLKLVYGLRVEQFNQVLTNAEFEKLHRKISDAGNVNSFLPSMNITMPIHRKMQLRAAYYKSLNRPEMREIAPFSFYNFNLNSEIVGNPKLKTASIHNVDFRYEFYTGGTGMFSVAVFGKAIANPIELSLDPTQPGIRTFTYNNEKQANIRGMEFELRQNFGKLFNMRKKHWTHNVTFYGNYASIKSQVLFNNNSSGTPNRALQGQSPYTANASIFYETEKGFLFTVNYSKIGDRIAFIGTPKSIQPFGMDIYEYGRDMLNIQVGYTMNKRHQFKWNIQDLFAQNSQFYQDTNGNKKIDATDNKLMNLKNGRIATFSYSYSF